MEKIKTYKKIVSAIITEIGGWMPDDQPIETQIIQDHEAGHYLLFDVGWEEEGGRTYLPFVHIDVKTTGKVWIQHDGTDLKIALLLYEKGIPKSDIVLGFRSSYQRELIPEFAVG